MKYWCNIVQYRPNTTLIESQYVVHSDARPLKLFEKVYSLSSFFEINTNSWLLSRFPGADDVTQKERNSNATENTPRLTNNSKTLSGTAAMSVNRQGYCLCYARLDCPLHDNIASFIALWAIRLVFDAM